MWLKAIEARPSGFDPFGIDESHTEDRPMLPEFLNLNLLRLPSIFLCHIRRGLITEPVFNDGLNFLVERIPGRAIVGSKPQVTDDTSDHVAFSNQGDDPHLAPAVRREERICLPDLPDQLPPLFEVVGKLE